MRGILQKSFAVIAALSIALTLSPLSYASAATTSTGSGYGGGCTIPVKPPRHGFSLEADPVYRPWWAWWIAPQVNLEIEGGNAYQMMISNSSNFSGATKVAYAQSKNWNVPSPQNQGWKKVYIKFFSSCGSASPVISTTYYYWGW